MKIKTNVKNTKTKKKLTKTETEMLKTNKKKKEKKKTEMWKTRDEENLIDRHVRLSKPVSASNNKKATKFCNKNKSKKRQ